jgi:hypothetical protein
MATAVWAPALALSQGLFNYSLIYETRSASILDLTLSFFNCILVTGMSAYVAVTANFIVCAFYTTLVSYVQSL